MAYSVAMPWNEGEERMHELMQVPENDNPTATMLTPQAASMLQRAPLLALGTLDSEGQPWTTLWGGNPGFSEPLGGGIIGTRTIVDGVNDPVVRALVGENGENAKGEMVQGDQKMVSGLTIDLMTRKRVKIFGQLLASSLDEFKVELEGNASIEGAPATQDMLQLVTRIDQSMGNCPKYLNQYEIQPALLIPTVVLKSSSLSAEAKGLISKADMFFLSSTTTEDMDTNHRGGPPGFVRILSHTEIVYPEYSGNRLYQSLGNLQINPKVGIVFPDYETGNVVYLTGTAEILVSEAAAALLPGSKLALKITISEVRFVESGLPFRGVRKEPSPYNPLVRTLPSEGNVKATFPSSRKLATLVKKETITPTIARFGFKVPEGMSYKGGQWVAFDFSKDMDQGYSHMRNDDPASLNDDFVRTFTISSAPSIHDDGADKTFEITIRKVGSVTGFIFRQREDGSFKVPVIGVGGELFLDQTVEGVHAFIAAGIGITPLLGQMPYWGKHLLWSVRAQDIDLVIDVFHRHFQLQFGHVSIFITGDGEDPEERSDIDKKIHSFEQSLRVKPNIFRRRMEKGDFDSLGSFGKPFPVLYLCAAKPFRKIVQQWAEETQKPEVIFEDFDY